MRACAFCRADDRAQIVRVGQFVADDDQRGLAPVFRVFEDLLDRRVGMRRDHGDHALMCTRGRKLVELAPVCFNDGGAGFSRHGGQPGKRAVCFSGSDVKLVDGAACGKRLLYGVAALEHIFCILRRLLRTADGRAAVVPVPFFLFHSFSSFRCHNNSQYSITASFGNLNPNLTIHRKFTCPPQVLSCKWGMGVIRFVTENSLLKFPTFSQKEGAFFE